LSVGYFAHVALNRRSLPADRCDRGYDFIGAHLIGAIAEGNVRTVPRQTFRDAATDSLVASRYRDCFTLKTVRHDFLAPFKFNSNFTFTNKTAIRSYIGAVYGNRSTGDVCGAIVR
jgi:hypothetical protein